MQSGYRKHFVPGLLIGTLFTLVNSIFSLFLVFLAVYSDIGTTSFFGNLLLGFFVARYFIIPFFILLNIIILVFYIKKRNYKGKYMIILNLLSSFLAMIVMNEVIFVLFSLPYMLIMYVGSSL